MSRQNASTSNMYTKSYVFDPRPNLPFRISAKRYWTDSNWEECANEAESFCCPLDSDETKAEELTLILAHANGYHKELWEPVINRLFEQQRTPGCPFRIQDMWAIDAPNHGDSAILNEEVLAWGYNMFSWEDYARCTHAFLAGLGSGVDIDFSTRNLVAVGHSMGATILMLSTTYFPSLTFLSMHLIEPTLIGKYGVGSISARVNAAENRRDIWESKQAAYEALKSRPTWREWDDRVLRIYVEHGLRPFPTVEYPDRQDGVTLKCTRKQEAASFRDFRSYSIAYRLLPHLLKIPTHITYGEIANFLQAEWRNDVLNNASGGAGKFASVNWVSNAGHLIIQTHPDAVAEIVWKSLLQSHSNGQSQTVMPARL